MKAKNLNKYTNWIIPDPKTLQADFAEYQKKEQSKWQGRAEMMGFRFPIFKNFQEFLQAALAGKVIRLSEKDWQSVHNLTRLGSIEAIKDLVSSYVQPRDVDRIYNGILNNDAIPMPIILKGTNGRWIMAGNTRANVANAMHVPVKALEIDVSSKKVEETTFDLQKKAGAIPFHIEGPTIQFMFMVPSDPKFGGTKPQIAKGGIDPGENSQIAAFREAKEELGLTRDNIESVIQVVTKKIQRPSDNSYSLTVYGAKVHDKYNFVHPHFETGETMWLTRQQFALHGEPEHFSIVEALYQKVMRIYMK